MLSRLRIGPKLWLAPGIVLVVLSLLSVGTYRAMARQNAALNLIVQQRASQVRTADELGLSAQRAHAQAYQVLAWLAGSFHARRIEPLVVDLHNRQGEVERGLADLARAAPARVPASGIDQARVAWRAYVKAVGDAVEIGHYDESIGAGAMVNAEAAFAIAAQRLGEVARREQTLAAQAASDAAADVRFLALLVPLVIGLSAATALAITLALRRGLLAEAGAIGAAATALAGGDFTVPARDHGGDEIGQAARSLDAGIHALNGTMRTVLEAARAIGSSSREIALGRAGMPARADTRDAFARATSSMQELAADIAAGAGHARTAGRAADDAARAAQQGGDAVHRLVTTLDTMRSAALRIEALGAAIEATSQRMAAGSGAGGAGAGRAERRSGRGRRAHEALTLRDLAQEAVAAAREAAALARQTAAAADGGGQWATQAGIHMAGLAGAVHDVGDVVEHIGRTGAGHAAELDGVSQAIVRMDEMSRQGARMVADAALAARNLQQQALLLSRAVASFRLDEVTTERMGAREMVRRSGVDRRAGSAAVPYLRLASTRSEGPR